MAQNVTVVYYPSIATHADAFYIMNINEEKIQYAFNNHDVAAVKRITIETDNVVGRAFRTIFTENDIQEFLSIWSIDY